MIERIKTFLLPVFLISISAFQFLYMLLIMSHIPIKAASILAILILSILIAAGFVKIKSSEPKRNFIGGLCILLFITFISIIASKFLPIGSVIFYISTVIIFILFWLKSKRAKTALSKLGLNHLEIINIFIFVFIAYYGGFGDFCRNYGIIDFDAQNFITWEYAAHKKFLLYKDIFYPYGILGFLKNSTILFNLIYALSSAAVLTAFFIVFKFLFKNRFFSYISFFILLLLASWNIIEFYRYGTVAIMSCAYAYILFKNYLQHKKCFLILGALLGLIFSLANDTGIYSSAIFLFILLIYPWLYHYRFKAILGYYKSLSFKLVFFIVGFILGILPFLVFLIKSHAVKDFFFNIAEFGAIGEYAKLSFWGSFLTKDNLFIFIPLAAAFIIISYRYANKRMGETFIDYLQLALMFTLLLLVQRNITRGGARQIDFISFVLILSFWPVIADYFRRYNVSKILLKIYFCLLILPAAFLLLRNDLTGMINLNYQKYINAYRWSFPNNIAEKIAYAKIDKCTKDVFDNIQKYLGNSYFKVKERLGGEQNFNGKIFSFPGDPVFYILFNQKPPKYFNAYEASPLYAQEAIIKFMETNQINYVIYNSANKSMDYAPYYVRNIFLYKYILNNFIIIDKIDNFLILKRSGGEDFFKNDFLNKVPEFKDFILNVDFGNIPASEGVNKKEYIEQNSEVVLENNISSTNKYLILRPKENVENKQYTISISTDAGQSKVSFRNCQNLCIINLSNMPLMFKSRVINKIDVEPGAFEKTQIVEIAPNKILW